MDNRIVDKIKSLVFKTDSCINYPYTNNNGYGDIQYRDNGIKKHKLAHRASYEIHNDIILKSEELVCHKCDNPSCINPLHLFKGTHADNVNDKVLKKRHAFGKKNGRYKHGFNSIYDRNKKPEKDFVDLYGRKINKEAVIKIKQLLIKKYSISEIYSITKVNKQTIKDIKYNRSYVSI